MTRVAKDNNTQDWAADCNGEGQGRPVRDGRDSGVVMMAAAAEHGSGGQQWRWWAMTAMAEDNSGGRQRRRMTTARKIEQQTTRRKEEGGWQTTMALGQPGRERETKIKKGVGYLAWKWIHISIGSWMGSPDGSSTKTKLYKPVSQIACISVSIFWY
jgi:hypothetical protein